MLAAKDAEYKRIRVDEKKEERPGLPPEKEIKVYSTGKDKTENGDSTIESQIDGNRPTDST